MSLGRRALVFGTVVLSLALSGCRQDMHDNPRIDPLEAHDFWADGMGSRQLPEGTIAQGLLKEDAHYWQGKTESGEFAASFPIEIDRAVLEHGQTRYEVFCSVCHDSTGQGQGMIVRRGFKQPPSLHEARLHELPAGYLYDVISNGFGTMSPYRNQISVDDRWAIVAYVRALQLSRNAPAAELPDAIRAELDSALAHATAAPDQQQAAKEEADGH